MTPLRSVPLAPRTTLGVGGAAAHYVEPTTLDELRGALEYARERALEVVVLGGGSNMLIADRGLAGLVVCLRSTGLVFDEASLTVRVDAGTPWDELVRWSTERGLSGLECLSGIPGSVGAAPMQNIGAYGQEVASTIVAVEVLERASGRLIEFTREACLFGYRESVFKTDAAEEYIVTSVTFELSKEPPSLRYAELARALDGLSAPSVSAVRDAVIELRRSKSMLCDTDDPNGRSAGSFFVNPTVSAREADELGERARRAGVTSPMPRFAHEGGVKLSAGWLIEHSGFAKGTRRGAVGLSTKHCLAIVTRHGATALEVVRFATEVRQRVLDVFGVTLSPEPRAYGFESEEVDSLYS